MSDKTETTAEGLTKQLFDLTKDWNEFDLVPKSQQAECRAIGEKLNSLGGLTLMQEVYRATHAKNRCASVIQAYWDGIGLWSW